MSTWYRTNRVALIGVLGSFLFGGLDVAGYYINGVSAADGNAPLGVLLAVLASAFTEAPSALRAGSDRADLVLQLMIGWQTLTTFAFAALLFAGSRLRQHSALANTLRALQLALAVLALSPLVYVLAAQLAIVLPLRRALRWLLFQAMLLGATFLYMVLLRDLQAADTAVATLAMHLLMGVAFQGIAFASARVALAERTLRLQLAAANASLVATQDMLAETVRSSERIRIARDLHDAVGHHLTALNLHLDLALRQAASPAPEPLRISRGLARSLLGEVRAVVSSERSEQRIELGAAITTLCEGIPAPAIELDIDDTLAIASPALAHTLFYCAQEALTNAMRHAGATRVQLALRAEDGAVRLKVSDNGHGARGRGEGNGLRGMRGRVAEQGGRLQAANLADRGFGIEITLPMARGAT